METNTSLDDGRGLEPRIIALIGRGAQGQRFAHELGPATTIGRAPEVDLRIDHTDVSRQHARITQAADGEFDVSDLGSKNGTAVNGEKLQAPRRLQPGDVIALGPAELEFRRVTASEFAQAQRTAAAWQRISELTDREREVAKLVAMGCKSADVASRLNISTRTVNTHLEHVFERLGIKSRTVLTRLVIEAGMLEKA